MVIQIPGIVRWYDVYGELYVKSTLVYIQCFLCKIFQKCQLPFVSVVTIVMPDSSYL